MRYITTVEAQAELGHSMQSFARARWHELGGGLSTQTAMRFAAGTSARPQGSQGAVLLPKALQDERSQVDRWLDLADQAVSADLAALIGGVADAPADLDRCFICHHTDDHVNPSDGCLSCNASDYGCRGTRYLTPAGA